MRTLLLGTDFMYNSSGQLVPIEINTNLGMEPHTVEDKDDIFDLSGLTSFITLNNFTGITYIGGLYLLDLKLRELCKTLNISYEYFYSYNKITVPEVEDTPEKLIIRSAYDVSAIVDEEYCKNKVNFLNLIKTFGFGSQFAYINDNDEFVSTISGITNNGNHPNFILKSILPQYDKNIYPKLYKVSTQEELNTILQNVQSNYYLTPFYYNPDKLWNNHVQVFRSFNLLFPPDLKSISIGQHTKLSDRNIDDFSTYDNLTFELTNSDRPKYITGNGGGISLPKLLDDDKVEMADGTFKTALDLQVDDVVKTIDMPPLDPKSGITYDEFISGTTYSTNKIIYKNRVDKLVDYVTITFTDNTTWEDTKNSSYLILRDNQVNFAYLNVENPISGIKIGDKIILIDTTYQDVVNTVFKEILSVTTTKQIFGGWEITVENSHVFLTQNVDNTSYAAIEHNIDCYSPNCTTGDPCPKTGPIYCNFLACSYLCVECTTFILQSLCCQTDYGYYYCSPEFPYQVANLSYENLAVSARTANGITILHGGGTYSSEI